MICLPSISFSVRQWEEPFDSALYCIETDGEDTMVVGTAHHGMIRLWDKRHSDPVQVYFKFSDPI